MRGPWSPAWRRSWPRLRLRKRIEGEWIIIAAGVLSVIAGVLLLIRPDIGAFAIALTIGAYAIVAGVMMIFLAFRLRKAGHDGATAPAAAGRTTDMRSDRDTERP